MSETQQQTAPAEQTKALTPEVMFRGDLTRMQPQFAMVLPSHIAPEKFVRVAMTAVMINPDFLRMDRKILIQELMKCATDGLIPDGREAAMVPYKGKPKYQPMVSGILKKCRNSGDLKSINPMVVYENDEFEYWVDENGPHLKHAPCFDRDPGKPRLTYAVAQTKDGGTYIEIITEAQMDKIRKASASGENGPWGGAFVDEMRKKSVIKRISKRLPSSTDLEEVLERDAEITEPREIQPHETPIQYQTLDVASSQVTEKAVAASKDPEPTPIFNDLQTQPPDPLKAKPYNHAPGSKNPPPKDVEESKPAEPVTQTVAAVVPDRRQLSIEIYKMCRDLNIDMKKKVLELTGVSDHTKLTTSQMVDMHTCLEIELANKKGEQE